jgi:6-phosphogluconolactonase
MAREIRILESPQDLFHAAAKQLISLNPRTIALSGGSTPKALYSLLAADYAQQVAWDKTYFFFGDERHVPPSDPESNFRMANEAMLSKVPIPPENVFRVPAENADAAAAASAYEKSIRDFFHLKPGEFPRFDLILLGMGPDGHTASLFPASKGLDEKTRIFISNPVEKFKTDRLTFTFPVLNNAANVMFLASGKEKAAILKQVWEDPASNLPSARVNPVSGNLIWLVDRAAASQLNGK